MQVSVATERWLIKLRDYFGKDKTPVLVFFLSFPPPGFSTTPLPQLRELTAGRAVPQYLELLDGRVLLRLQALRLRVRLPHFDGMFLPAGG